MMTPNERRIAISGVAMSTITAASTLAGVMIGHKYWDTRLGGGLLGFFVLAPLANAIAFPFHGPGALRAMQADAQIQQEVEQAMRQPPVASNTLSWGSGASPRQRYEYAAQRNTELGLNQPPTQPVQNLRPSIQQVA